jgi:hypothetical protein
MEDIDEIVEMSKIVKEWYYYCRKCSFYSTGEAICMECDKDFKSNGRITYIYYFKS